MIELRLRTRYSDESIKPVVGHMLTPEAVQVLLRGPCRVLQPDGRLLCLYLPGLLVDECTRYFDHLNGISGTTEQRGPSGASRRYVVNSFFVSRSVRSVALGYLEGIRGGGHADPNRRRKQCRLTSMTGPNQSHHDALGPFYQRVAGLVQEHAPDAYRRQMRHVEKTPPQFVIPGTPFTTITVNNTYATGVHKDKGDLDEGISCLVVARRGEFSGGELVFPQYGVAIPGRHGDVVLMDAHQWHGNVEITDKSEDATRVSCVFYYRTRMKFCPDSGEPGPAGEEPGPAGEED